MKIIYVPCKNNAEAKKIANALLNKKLVACGNFFECNSMYKWKGKLEQGKETILLLKTTKPFPKIKKEIEKLHSYKVPCIAELPVRNLNSKYHKWLLEELK